MGPPPVPNRQPLFREETPSEVAEDEDDMRDFRFRSQSLAAAEGEVVPVLDSDEEEEAAEQEAEDDAFDLDIPEEKTSSLISRLGNGRDTERAATNLDINQYMRRSS